MYTYLRNTCIIALNLAIAIAYLCVLTVCGTTFVSVLLMQSTEFVASLIEVTRFLGLAAILTLFVWLTVTGIVGSYTTIRNLYNKVEV